MALQALQRDVQTARHERLVGTTLDVLADAQSPRRSWELSGRSMGNTIVNFPGPAEYLGCVLPVRITDGTPNAVRGEALVDRPESRH